MKKNNAIQKSIRNLLSREMEALDSLRAMLGDDFYKAVDILSKVRGKIVVSGMGKSGHIGMKVASTLISLGIPSVFLHPGEAAHGDLGVVGRRDALIAISKSGETKELLRVVRHMSRHKMITVAITENKKSSIARLSNATLAFKIKEEGSPFNIAPMASTTASLVIGDMLAAALSLKRGFRKEDFADFHPGGALGLQLGKVEELMAKGNKTPLVSEDVSFSSALKKITKNKLGIAGVVSRKGKLIGVITDGDIRRFLLSSGFSLDARASAAMTKNPKTITKNASLQDAMVSMEGHKIMSLFVVDDSQRPLGIIHMHTIIEERVI